MTYSELITPTYMYTQGVVDDNVDAQLLIYAIQTAQDIEIVNLLGQSLYRSLMAQVAVNTYNSTYYSELLSQFVAPALYHYALYHGADVLKFKITNKSILNPTSDHSTATDRNDLIYLKQGFYEKAQRYGQMCIVFLQNNQAQFPELYKITEFGAPLPAPTANFNGVVLREYPLFFGGNGRFYERYGRMTRYGRNQLGY